MPGWCPAKRSSVSVDAIDGQTFQGTVSSLAPASGAVFSLLPPENATGNFTKVVQRVPVRIDVPADVLKTRQAARRPERRRRRRQPHAPAARR